MKENLCFFVTPEHTSYFERMDIPAPRDDQVIIKTMATGICGSDIHFYKDGKVGAFALEKPYVPGHESAGIVYSVGKNVRNVAPGDRVIIEPGIPCRFCKPCAEGRYNLCENYLFQSGPASDGTFRNYFPIRSDMVYKIPDDMDFELAALAEPVAVALHVLKRAGAVTGKTVAIFGLGPIGMLVGMAAKALGAGKIVCIDINQRRLDRALELCADEVINSKETPVPEDFAEVLFETAGSPVTVGQLFQAAASGARAVQVGWLKDDVAMINVSAMLGKELDYVASYNYANEFPAAIRLMSSGRIDAKQIVTHTFRFEETDMAFEYTVNNSDEVIKTIVKYE